MKKNRYIEGLQFENPHPFRRESDSLAKSFYENTIIENGIIRWKSSKNIPPVDVLEFWLHLGYEFDFNSSVECELKEAQEFLNDYRLNYKGPSQEEMYEMQAAFGKGTKVVNIITGTEITL